MRNHGAEPRGQSDPMIRRSPTPFEIIRNRLVASRAFSPAFVNCAENRGGRKNRRERHTHRRQGVSPLNICSKLFLVGSISLIPISAAVGGSFTIIQRTITQPTPGIVDPLDGPTDARWSRFPDGRIEVRGDDNSFLFDATQRLSVQIGNNHNERSALEFNLSVLPDYEKVTSARLTLDVLGFNVQTLFNVGYIRHLDAARAVGNPGSTWSYADLAGGTIVGNLGPSLANQSINETYDLTSAVAADHHANAVYSPYSLVEDPMRGFNARVDFASEEFTFLGSPPKLVVETAPPDPVRAVLESLGGTRFRYDYTLTNDVNLPIELLDIAFDSQLYAEGSLTIVSTPALDTTWDQEVLASGIDVPAVLTLSALAGGVLPGGNVGGFAIEFDWLGAGMPGVQPITVYNAATFEPLYTRNTQLAAVPLPGAGWLLLTGIGILSRRRSSHALA